PRKPSRSWTVRSSAWPPPTPTSRTPPRSKKPSCPTWRTWCWPPASWPGTDVPKTIVKMPQLGESVAEGTIGRWLKQPGDRVERDEPLVEIQTDKVNAEVPSPVAGVLQEILLPEGTTAAVKSDMAVIGDEGDAEPAVSQPSSDEPRKPADVPTPSN